MNPSRSDLATKLFVLALYYWYNDDRFNARNAIDAAVHVAKMPTKKVA